MSYRRAPDAVDTGLVFRIYSWIAIAGGLWVLSWGGAGYRWPLPPFEEVDLPAVPYGRASLVLIAAVVVIAAGLCAAGFGRVANPADQRRGLYLFSFAHLAVGTVLLSQWSWVWRDHLPLTFALTPVMAGALLFNLAFSAHGLPRFGDGLLARAHTAEDNLTSREVDVLRLVALGQSNREIAGALRIGEETVKTHVAHVLSKLQVENRAQAIVHALKRGLRSLDDLA